MNDSIEHRFKYHVFCGLWPTLNWAMERNPKETAVLLREFRFPHLRIWYGADMAPSHQDRLISLVNKLYSVRSSLALPSYLPIDENGYRSRLSSILTPS